MASTLVYTPTAAVTTTAASPSFIYDFTPESTSTTTNIQSNIVNKSNRHSVPSSNILWEQHHQQQQQQQQQQLMQKQQRFQEKPSQQPSPPPGRAGGPRLSLDTSQERLQKFTVIKHGDQTCLKLFSPNLVESPVSFLSEKQLLEDKKLWENGPDEAFQRKLEMERREAYQVRSKQQLRGFVLGIWVGCLVSLLIVQQTAAKVYIPSHLARRDTSPLLFLMVLLSCVAAVRSGARCILSALATCTAVLTCFATMIANHSRYSVEFNVYKSIQAESASKAII